MSTRSEEPHAFDLIIEKIGNAGPFQKRFNIVFNFFLVITAAMPHLNLVVTLAVPDHWCHLPGRDNTTYSLEQWKDMTIPKEYDSKGLVSYSKCTRYLNPCPSSVRNETLANVNVTKCDSGWEYDHTWYDLTAPMQNNWVCDDSIVSANALAIGRLGEVIGTLIFGQLADIYGRRPIFFASVVTLVFGRVMATLTSAWVYAFMAFSFISSLPGVSVFQGPIVIAMEISRAEDRAWINLINCMGWNVGLIIMPFFMWWLRDWVPFLLATTLPCGLFLFSCPWMIESPRWLASKGKIKSCCKELKIVAKTNKTEMPPNTEAVLKHAVDTQDDAGSHPILALFSNLALVKQTVALVVCWAILIIIYTCVTMNVNNLSGNPFLNYLLQACAEFPSYLIGKYVCDRYGRRWTNIGSYILTFLSCISVLFVINDSSAVIVVNGLNAVMKFGVSLAFYSLNLHSMEIYPTCVRQTGTSVSIMVGSMFGVLSPYIVDLGTSVNVMLPYIIYAVSAIFAAMCCLLLPETHGRQLPESLADASNFAANQNIWGKPKSQKVSINNEAAIPLTQTMQSKPANKLGLCDD